MTYPSECGEYQLYKADQVFGVPWSQYGRATRWLAIYRHTIIGRHRTKKAAKATCNAHKRQLWKLASTSGRTKKLKRRLVKRRSSEAKASTSSA